MAIKPRVEAVGAQPPPAASPPKSQGWDGRAGCAHAPMWPPQSLPAEGNYPSQRAAWPLSLQVLRHICKGSTGAAQSGTEWVCSSLRVGSC